VGLEEAVSRSEKDGFMIDHERNIDVLVVAVTWLVVGLVVGGIGSVVLLWLL
jgi:hypothetical protein